ncbi:MAG: sulfite exporter TauE/SafE family protein, partial [Alphaproteobacteria bacterium]|nr:sulfite exporter TauE/SafE family protein [Alphaproteobacteria bacterium]
RGFVLSERGLGVSAVVWGVIVGGTSGAGIILLSMLMSIGLEGAAVIATDAAISVIVGVVKIGVFGIFGAVDARVIAVALLIGCVAFPGAFLAKALVDRMPVHVHTAILDAVVIAGGVLMMIGAFRQ